MSSIRATSLLLGRWGQGCFEEDHTYVGIFLKECNNKVDALLEEGMGVGAGVGDDDGICFC